ncbi:MAG: hypothetical protein HGN29_01570 [Asgard group archaeon]|nr:hypothetical protein [Asgard group archaeon]
MSEYSNYKLGKVDLETENAYLAIIDNFTDREIWVPKSVVGPDKRIKQWFINQKDKELKDFMRKKKQSDLARFF